MAQQALISTGDIHVPYQVIDTIAAVGSSTSNWTSATVLKAMNDVKSQLSKDCIKMGGNAVINCQFEHRVALSGIIFKKQVVQLLAYGTIVKIN